MKRLLTFCLIVMVAATVYLSKTSHVDQQVSDDKHEIVTLGFDNSGTPKSIEEDWGGWKMIAWAQTFDSQIIFRYKWLITFIGSQDIYFLKKVLFFWII